jgi:hypothetical protein
MATYSGKKRTGAGMGFLDTLAQIESANRNIPSGVDPDVAGPGTKSQGYFQINTPTWRDFAPKAGVDLSQYPAAMAAPREVQAQVAGYIPFGRFGPRTQRMMADRYGGPLNRNLTVAELAARYGGTGGGTVPAGSGVPTVAVASATPSGDAARRQVSPELAGAMNQVAQGEENQNNDYWRRMIAGMDFSMPQAAPQAPVSGIIEPPPPVQVQAPLGTGGLAQLGAPQMAQAPIDPQAQRQEALAKILQQLNAPTMRA